MENKWKLACIGVISGLLSYYAFAPRSLLASKIQEFLKIAPLYYMPGVIFAITFVFYFFIAKKGSILKFKTAIWIILSTLAYFLAVSATLKIFTIEKIKDWNFVAFLIGGFIGSLVMLFAFHFFLSRLSAKQFIVLLITGSLLGLSWYLGKLVEPTIIQNELSLGGFLTEIDTLFQRSFYLFLIWQTGMAFALGWVLDKKESAIIANR